MDGDGVFLAWGVDQAIDLRAVVVEPIPQVSDVEFPLSLQIL
jgi:hypothetical protein